LFEQNGTNPDDKSDKHRFLVQSKVIEDADFVRLNALNPTQRLEEVKK
jgi:hypothetical protein